MSQLKQYTVLASLQIILGLGILVTTPARAGSFQDEWVSLGSMDFMSGNTDVVFRGNGEGHGVGKGQKGCYLAQIPSRGTWTLEVGTSALSETDLKVELFEPTSGPSSSIHIRKQFASNLEIQVLNLGLYWACISAQDPEQVLGDYQLHSTFRGEPLSSEEDPDEHESDALGFSDHQKSEEDPDEHEPDAQPLVETLPPALDRSSCRSRRTDDHDDTFRCATTILVGAEIEARIENDWADDRDVFVFRIDSFTSIEAEATGSPDLVGALYDSSGYRLSVGRRLVGEQGFRLAKTLIPGFYYLRMESRYGLPISYRLRLNDLGKED